MKQGSSGEANSYSTSEEIFRLLWNLKVHYRVHHAVIQVEGMREILVKIIHVVKQFMVIQNAGQTECADVSRLARNVASTYSHVSPIIISKL
jgi:hypothetical protein